MNCAWRVRPCVCVRVCLCMCVCVCPQMSCYVTKTLSLLLLSSIFHLLPASNQTSAPWRSHDHTFSLCVCVCTIFFYSLLLSSPTSHPSLFSANCKISFAAADCNAITTLQVQWQLLHLLTRFLHFCLVFIKGHLAQTSAATVSTCRLPECVRMLSSNVYSKISPSEVEDAPFLKNNSQLSIYSLS